MPQCSNANCSESAVFLEAFCWQHLEEERKSSYSERLLQKINEVKAVRKENFHDVVLREVEFPEGVGFLDCNFTNADLTRTTLRRADLRGSNFSDAILHDCHFEQADFREISSSLRGADARGAHFDGALLQNVDFTQTDLRDAIFIDADMIGAMLLDAKLYSSRFSNTRLRKDSLCNFEQKKPGEIRLRDEMDDNLIKPTPLLARFVYTSLKNNFKSVGEYEDQRWAYLKERQMERKRLFRLAFLGDRYADALAIEHWKPDEMESLYESRLLASLKWLASLLSWLIGYGHRPFRIFGLAAVIIFISAILLMFGGYEYTTDGVVINRDLTFRPSQFEGTMSDLSLSFYVSIVTFTTLGYGDAKPLGYSKVVASAEALSGVILMALFVGTLARSITPD